MLVFYLVACSAVQGAKTFVEARVYQAEMVTANSGTAVQPPGPPDFIELNTYTRTDYQEFMMGLREQDIPVSDRGRPILETYLFASIQIDPEGKFFPEPVIIEVERVLVRKKGTGRLVKYTADPGRNMFPPRSRTGWYSTMISYEK